MAVDRTCTEIRPGRNGGLEFGESRPLSAFGSLQAYVLLGDPGAGKTTEFKNERRALGGAAVNTSARGISFGRTSNLAPSGGIRRCSSMDSTRCGQVPRIRGSRWTRFATASTGSAVRSSASPVARRTGSATTIARVWRPSRQAGASSFFGSIPSASKPPPSC